MPQLVDVQMDTSTTEPMMLNVKNVMLSVKHVPVFPPNVLPVLKTE